MKSRVIPLGLLVLLIVLALCLRPAGTKQLVFDFLRQDFTTDEFKDSVINALNIVTEGTGYVSVQQGASS